jgi:hypothetical protein
MFRKPRGKPSLNRGGIAHCGGYAAILGQVQKDGDTKLVTLLELLRWFGMALVDATLFDTKSVVNGTLDYKRQESMSLDLC